MLDLNFNYRTEGYLAVTRALDDLNLDWFEIDIYDPTALSLIRRAARTPIASCESLFGLRGYRPFFEYQAMDVAIVDVPWNGIWQSMKIAALAESFEVNVAPHNFYGHLSTLMSATSALQSQIFESWRSMLMTSPGKTISLPILRTLSMENSDSPTEPAGVRI